MKGKEMIEENGIRLSRQNFLAMENFEKFMGINGVLLRIGLSFEPSDAAEALAKDYLLWLCSDNLRTLYSDFVSFYGAVGKGCDFEYTAYC